MATHQNAATLGIALDLQMGNFATEAQKVAYETQKMKNAIAREMKAADKEIQSLKYATEDYGKAVSKVTQIERELATGRLKDIKGSAKAQELLAQAAAYDKVAASARNAAGAQFKMNEQQKIQLTYQTTDLFTQIASGQSPFIAIIQQGGQLKDAMGGIGNMFRAVGSLITPFTVGITAAAAAVGSLAYSFYKAGDQSAELRDNLILTGNFAGTTQSQVVALSNSLSEDLSVGYSKANDVVLALVSSGKFSSSTFDVMSKAILQFSKLSGVDAKEAASKLMGAFDGTASSIRTLNQQYNFLTFAQYKQIEALEKAGKTQEAIQIGAKAFSDSIEGQTRDLGYLESAWNKLGKALDYVKNMLLSIGRNTDQDKLLALAKDIEIISSNIGGTDSESIARRSENKKLLQEKINDYLATANKIQADTTEAEKKGEEKRAQQRKISESAKYGQMLTGKEFEVQKAKIDSAFRFAQIGANEIEKLELESARKIVDAYDEMRQNNQKEDYRATAQNLEIYKNKVLAAESELAEKKRQINSKDKIALAKAQVEEDQRFKDMETQFAQMQANAKWDAVMQTQSLERQKEGLMLKNEMLYATEKEMKLAEITLRYQQKRDDNIGKGKDVLDNLDAQEKLEKFNVEIADSMKKTQQVFDTVFGNLSSAIDNFVKTGKLNMKDLARSIIQDLIAIQMKAAALRFLGAMFGGFNASAGYNQATTYASTASQGWLGFADGGDPPVGKASIVGERGPELFVPRSAGTIIPNHALGSIGNTTNVTNNYINAIDTKSFEDRLLGSSNAIWAANQYANKSLAVGRGRA